MTWGGITSTTTHVASIDDVTEVEDNIEDGIVDYDMRRYMGVKVQGAIVDINSVNGDVFRAEHMVIVDVSDITKQFVDGQFNEYYRIHRTNRLAPPVPGSATMGQIDTVYLARWVCGGIVRSFARGLPLTVPRPPILQRQPK